MVPQGGSHMHVSSERKSHGDRSPSRPRRILSGKIAYVVVACVAVCLTLTLAACGKETSSGQVDLPPNLIVDHGTQISDFEDVGDWRVTGGFEDVNSTEFEEGNGSIDLGTVERGGKVSAETAIAQDLSGPGQIRFWVSFAPGWRTTVSSVNLQFASTPDFGRSFTYYLGDLSGLHEGWNLISLAKSDFTGSDGASWQDPMVRARVEVRANPGELAQVGIDDLRVGVEALSGVVISFDDGDESVYTRAYPIMAALGLKGTAYVVSSRVGGPGRMTITQLRELYYAGWDIGNHSRTHPDLAALKLEAVEKELLGCTGYLVSNGLPAAARHVSYPDGSYDDTVLQAMGNTGMLTGRTVEYRVEALPLDDAFQMPASPTNPTELSVGEIKSRIDRAAREGAIIELFFHAIGPFPDNYTQSVANFTAICDYIHQRGVRTFTVSELYALNKP